MIIYSTYTHFQGLSIQQRYIKEAEIICNVPITTFRVVSIDINDENIEGTKQFAYNLFYRYIFNDVNEKLFVGLSFFFYFFLLVLSSFYFIIIRAFSVRSCIILKALATDSFLSTRRFIERYVAHMRDGDTVLKTFCIHIDI